MRRTAKQEAINMPMIGDCEKLLTVFDAAALLRLTPKGVYALVEGRRIPFIRVSNRVRFIRKDVLNWLWENRVPALERNR
jgi:excisionase family DNA binding protein